MRELPLHFSADVAQAREQVRPIVALESTIIAHGLPYPDNLGIARELEQAVRDGGAVPATIALVDGEARIGLDSALLERLARDGASFRKAGAADLAVFVARRSCAATTVSATTALAAAAGISVFATGGIGGVHRGDASDVSSDLSALSRYPVAVVSAGAKAILNLSRTLEMLETLGVLVLGFQTSQLPAFYCRESGLELEHRVDQISELASIAHARWQLGQGGILVANPIAAEDAVPRPEVEAWIADGLAAAAAAGVRGKPLTPFLLGHLAKVSSGRAVAANRSLALGNARLAASLACALGN